MVSLVWLIPALPLAGFVLLLAFGRRMGEPIAGWFGTLAIAAAFVTALIVFAGLWNEPDHTFTQHLFTWIPAGSFQVGVGILLDPLSMVMVLFITFIAAFIHLYSIGYMHGDPRFSKFFVYLNLFVFSMLVLVLADNMLLTFVGWEGVGVCSYFLISFWFTKEANASAGKKAFVTNRVGDWGFMIAMFATFLAFGSLNYGEIIPLAPGLAQGTATLIAVMLFLGACGKSAQIPLYIWLPDAMAGPTPVSALIHAATMVTAGVYLLVRVNPILFTAAPWVLTLIAIVGAATAFIAATIAMAQHDIKKVLAYSTISQIGYMFLAVGSGAYVLAIFHMVTHAFFKGCLFLGSGSVIHGMDGEQDMRRMGALRKVMPITAITFMCAWLAISGVPPFSGFWSKDEILGAALHKSAILYVVGLTAALFTAYYMSRLVFLTFFGKARWNDPAEQVAAEADTDVSAHAPAGDEIHPHESPWLMTVPLIVLAFFAVFAGLLNLPFTPRMEFLNRWLEPVVAYAEVTYSESALQLWILLGISTVFALAGIFIARLLWLEHRVPAEKLEPKVLIHAWYYDSAIAAFMNGPGRRFADLSALFDRKGIDGAVNGVGRATRGGGARVRLLETGYVRTYALTVAVGAIALTVFVLTRVISW